MQARFAAFVDGESGAVTVDWVVLSAAVIGIGMLVLIPIAFSANSMSNMVGRYISSLEPGAQD